MLIGSSIITMSPSVIVGFPSFSTLMLDQIMKVFIQIINDLELTTFIFVLIEVGDLEIVNYTFYFKYHDL